MQTKKIAMDITRMLTLIDMYDSLANKEVKESDIYKTRTEMKVIKESLLSLIIETKKSIRKTENTAKP